VQRWLKLVACLLTARAGPLQPLGRPLVASGHKGTVRLTFDGSAAANDQPAAALKTQRSRSSPSAPKEKPAMSTPNARRPALLPLTALFAALSLFAATGAGAREKEVTGPKGHSATRQVEREKGKVESSVTGEQGKTRARAVERSQDGASAAITRRDGSSVERDTTRTEAGSTSTLTGSKGGSATAETTRTETGSTTTVTGANGKAKTVEHTRGSLRDRAKARRENKQ
jgi:hypothetical protein